MSGRRVAGETLGGPRAADDSNGSADGVIERMLRAVREHLDLDVGFVGEVVGGERVFRYVDSKPGVDVVAVGDSDPLEEGYCHQVLAGRLPEFLRDPSRHPVAANLRVTKELPVGSHLSVPIRFSDGRVYGTFCCFAFDVRPSLDPRDLSPLRMVADLAAEYLEAIDAVQDEQRRRHQTIKEVLEDPDALTLVFQPLRDLETMEIIALEALARFPGHERGPAWLFAEAADVGLGVELEMRAVRMALGAFDHIPESLRLNVNVSPTTLCSRDFFDAIARVSPERLVVEVTEHAAIDDYGELQTASARLAAAGIRLAIDDVGMGFSGLNRILQSSPRELKLDAAVIRDVHAGLVKQALIESFCIFGERAGVKIVAEGIECAAELGALRALGIKFGQGYHLGRPEPLQSLVPRSPRALPPPQHPFLAA